MRLYLLLQEDFVPKLKGLYRSGNLSSIGPCLAGYHAGPQSSHPPPCRLRPCRPPAQRLGASLALLHAQLTAKPTVCDPPPHPTPHPRANLRKVKYPGPAILPKRLSLLFPSSGDGDLRVRPRSRGQINKTERHPQGKRRWVPCEGRRAWWALSEDPSAPARAQRSLDGQFQTSPARPARHISGTLEALTGSAFATQFSLANRRALQ